MQIELSLLRLLVDIDRTASMTATARRLAYTPSAVSQQVKRLEAAVGTAVVERHARGVRLTDAGRLVVDRALAIETHLSALRVELDDLAGARIGQLALGVFPTFAASLLPEVMARYRASHPGVRLSIRSSRLRHLHRMLQAHEVDLSLAWDYPETPLTAPDLELLTLGADPTVLLVPRRTPLSDDSALLASWAREPWIVRADQHPITGVLVDACRQAGFEPDVLVEANDYMEAQAMVAAGLGVSVAPRMATRFLREDVVALAVGTQLPDRRLLLARLVTRETSPAADAMSRLLRALIEEDPTSTPGDPG